MEATCLRCGYSEEEFQDQTCPSCNLVMVQIEEKETEKENNISTQTT